MKLDHIKDKFENREIQPNAESWEKLSQRLDATEKKNRKPIVVWFSAIAALLVLGLIIYPSLSMNYAETPAQNSVVVEGPGVKELDPKINLLDTIKKEEQPKAIHEIALEEKIAITGKEQPIKTPVITSKKAYMESIAYREEKAGTQTTNVIEENSIAIEDKRPMPVDNEGSKFSESDILLNKALQKLKVERTAVVETSGINPQKLLRETEWDLEARNHNRLENTLLDGLSRLKREAVALIDRNQ